MRVAVTKHLNGASQIFALGTFVKHAAAEQLSKLNQIEPTDYFVAFLARYRRRGICQR
jgi:recombinational DNA repair protein (RecF pathway)